MERARFPAIHKEAQKIIAAKRGVGDQRPEPEHPHVSEVVRFRSVEAFMAHLRSLTPKGST